MTFEKTVGFSCMNNPWLFRGKWEQYFSHHLAASIPVSQFSLVFFFFTLLLLLFRIFSLYITFVYAFPPLPHFHPVGYSTTVEGRYGKRKKKESGKQGNLTLWLTGAKVDTSPLDRATTKSSEWKPWLVNRDAPSMPAAVSVSSLSSCS